MSAFFLIDDVSRPLRGASWFNTNKLAPEVVLSVHVVRDGTQEAVAPCLLRDVSRVYRQLGHDPWPNGELSNDLP